MLLCRKSAILRVILISSFMILGVHLFTTIGKPSMFDDDDDLLASATANATESESIRKNQSLAAEVDGYSTNINSSLINKDILNTLSDKDKPLLCGNNVTNSNSYVKEYITPILCSQPVGITVDKDNNIWIASGKSGTLLVFNPHTLMFEKTIKIPNWPEQHRNIGSMIWEMKFDKNGDLWFTDELSNSIWKYFVKEGKFENYKLLSEGGYPLSITFDSNNNLWFTQVFGNRLGFLEPTKVTNNTTKGISELDMSREINFQTMGPISNGFGFSNADNSANITSSTSNNNNNNNNETLWFSTAVFPVGGQIIKFDINSQALTIHDINHTKSVPFSIAEDENGTLWTNSHITNLFLSLDQNTGAIKKYATSNPSNSGNLTTLPYINMYRDGKVWFNEHYGNAMASYDPKNKTLVEYYIPSHNPLWVNSSNPLRFTFDNNGSIWFTEWTENKLGVIPVDRLNQIPISLGVSKDNVTLDSLSGKGDALDVYIYNNPLSIPTNMNSSNSKVNNSTAVDVIHSPNELTNITMSVTSSMSKNGKLDNLTSSFSPNFISTKDIPASSPSELNPMQPFKTTLKIEPKDGNIILGNYTLTITAKYGDDIAISKIIDMIIQ